MSGTDYLIGGVALAMDEISIGQLVGAELNGARRAARVLRQIVGRLLGLSILHREDGA